MSRTIITWAVAALLAVPAVPMFAKVSAAHKLTTHHKTAKALIATGKKHRTLHHTKVKHTALISSARAGKHLSSTIKHTARQTSTTTVHPQVHVASPVLIDGMHT